MSGGGVGCCFVVVGCCFVGVGVGVDVVVVVGVKMLVGARRVVDLELE